MAKQARVMIHKDLRQRFPELELRFMNTIFKLGPKNLLPATSSKYLTLIMGKVTTPLSTTLIPPQASSIPEIKKGN